MQSDSGAVTVVSADAKIDPSSEVLDSLRTRFVARGLNPLSSVVNLALHFWVPRHALQESATSYAYFTALAGLSFLVWCLIDRSIGNIEWLPAYVGMSLEYGNAYEDRDDISLAAQQCIDHRQHDPRRGQVPGPVYPGYGHAEQGHDGVYRQF